MTTRTPRRYTMTLRSVGNPDLRQYAAPAPEERVAGPSLRAMVAAQQLYVRRWDLGGGNFPTTPIRDASRRIVAYVSYNGRLWDSPDTIERPAREIRLRSRKR